MPYISKDLSEAINSGRYFDPSEIREIHVKYLDEGKYLFDRCYFFSKTFFDTLSLKDSYEIESEEDEFNFREIIKDVVGLTCVDCFKDFMTEAGLRFEL